MTLKFHALACLGAAAFSSGLLLFIAQSMTEATPPALMWRVAFVAVCTLPGYAAVLRWRQPSRFAQLFSLPMATLASASATALLVWALARTTAAGTIPEMHYLAVIRTLVTCGMALTLAFIGSRWQHGELRSLAWVALAFVAFKLLYEDLRHGHLGFTAVSIFLFAITLLLVPRLARVKQRVAA